MHGILARNGLINTTFETLSTNLCTCLKQKMVSKFHATTAGTISQPFWSGLRFNNAIDVLPQTFGQMAERQWPKTIGNQLAREKDTREFATMMNPVFFQKFAANICPESHQCSLFFLMTMSWTSPNSTDSTLDVHTFTYQQWFDLPWFCYIFLSKFLRWSRNPDSLLK